MSQYFDSFGKFKFNFWFIRNLPTLPSEYLLELKNIESTSSFAFSKPKILSRVVMAIFLRRSIFALMTPAREVVISIQTPFLGKIFAPPRSFPVVGDGSEEKITPYDRVI